METISSNHILEHKQGNGENNTRRHDYKEYCLTYHRHNSISIDPPTSPVPMDTVSLSEHTTMETAATSFLQQATKETEPLNKFFSAAIA
jgi:hypothetical protein